MPIYEYQCKACGEKMEKLQKISDPVLLDCPLCGKSALQKMVTAAGFRLKGSGWYETDFKTEGKRNLAGDQESSDTASAGSKATADKSASESKVTAAKAAGSDSKNAKPASASKPGGKTGGKGESPAAS
ncbi:MAG: zinc ribbon domain-containing protein [Wenzhouxiangellaceae bacterium]